MSSAPDSSGEPCGSLLYHYTGTTGLLGILENRCLFASDIWFLNDAAEVRFAQSRMLGRLAERDDLGDDLAWLRELLETAGSQAAGPDALFVTSFCEEADLLGLWRGYAAGGAAIGFARDELAGIGADAGARLVKVDYGREPARERLHGLFEEVAAAGPYPADERERIARTVLGPELARVKEPSFFEEREWRLLVTNASPEQVRFRVGAAGLVPYVEIPLPSPSPVREIVIGPGDGREVRRRGVEQLLRLRGYEDVIVRDSTSSLRW